MKERQLCLYGIGSGQHNLSSLQLIIRETLVRLYRYGVTIPKRGIYQCSHIRSNKSCPMHPDNTSSAGSCSTIGMEEV